jgi:ABC-2 type transport system ATP-binding protein
MGDHEAMLQVLGVSKRYGSTPALAGVNLQVEAGEILGLLGPNGAGKTTLVSIVAGLRRPDTGSVHVGGIDVVRSPHQARGLIGIAPQETGVYLPLSVRDNLRLFAGLAGLRGREQRTRIDELAGALGLSELMARRASALSGGERRRLHAAIALVHRPALVLLDEPTTGADVQTRGEILRLVGAIAAEGSAVVYSTHYLHEIEEMQASVAFIDHGSVIARGALGDLIAAYGASALELTFGGDVPAVARVAGAIVEGATVRIPSDDPAQTAAQLLPRLGEHAGDLRAIEIVRPSLESVYVTVTGRRYDPALEPAA